MSKMWEVDPETRSKLQEISKTNENSRCVDCGAPSPQWASPKFGIFFCLACSGIHRSLGVHISFVRSVTMDAFKTGEVRRMELGGNKPWRDFFNKHQSNKLMGRDFDGCTISERYDSDVGEEWKDRLTAKVEGTEYVPGSSKPANRAKKPAETDSRSSTPLGGSGSGRNTPLSNVRSAPQRNSSPSQKQRNEAFFAKMGEENSARPDHVPPSQGGKYAGFGSAPMPTNSDIPRSAPSADDFQKDPVAALSKGFGWLSTTLTKQAASVNQAYIQPGMKSFADGEFAAQARATAMQLGTTVQQGAKGFGDQFNRFVDPDGQPTGPGAPGARRTTVEPEHKEFWDSFGQAPTGPPKDKKDFWDSFAAAGDAASRQKVQAPPKTTSIGTSAMKTSSNGGAANKKDDGDGWGDW